MFILCIIVFTFPGRDKRFRICLPSPRYYTGQFFDVHTITKAAHKVGATAYSLETRRSQASRVTIHSSSFRKLKAMWDCAHAVGNIAHSWVYFVVRGYCEYGDVGHHKSCFNYLIQSFTHGHTCVLGQRTWSCMIGMLTEHAGIALRHWQTSHRWVVSWLVLRCNYKYLNSGPGAIGGFFVHRKHHDKGLD